MDAITFLVNHFWAVGIAVAALNTAILWQQVQPRIRKNPALGPGYTRLVWGYWAYFTFPWAGMGVGIVGGAVPAVWYFLIPQAGYAYVLGWWVAHWLVNILLSYWIWLQGGAQMLFTHPGLLRGNPKSAKQIKLVWLVMMVGSVVATIVIFSQPPLDVPSFSGI